MAAPRIVLVGSGGHARVVVAAARAAGVQVEAVYDDAESRWGGDVLGVPVRGAVESAAGAGLPVHIAVGDNAARRRLAERLGAHVHFASIVHPTAWLAPGVVVEPGACVMAGAVLQPGAVIGAHAIVNTSASVDHDSTLGAFVHLAPGARLAGGVTVGEGAFLGVGTVAVPGCRIGAWSIVGAGAVVVKDLPANVTAVGMPAAPIKERPAGWHL